MTGKVFSGVREKWRPLYETLRGMVAEAAGAFEEYETPSALRWKHSSSFAEVSAKKDALVVAFPSDVLHDEWEPAKALQTSKNRTVHYFEVRDGSMLPVLVSRIQVAYALTKTARPSVRAPKSAYTTVDEYIAAFPPETAGILQAIRKTVREAAPEATEKISWQMPTYHLYENIVHFAAAKNHVSLFPSPAAIAAFSGRLTGYKTTKGGIQFPLSEPVPYDLIGEITWQRAELVKAKRCGGAPGGGI